MASLIPPVPAPPAAPPAGRPGRPATAAGPVGDDTFDQALARSAESADRASATPSATSDVPKTPVEEPRASDPARTDATPEPWVTGWLAVPVTRSAPAVTTEADTVDAKTESGVDLVPEPVPELAPAAAPDADAAVRIGASTDAPAVADSPPSMTSRAAMPLPVAPKPTDVITPPSTEDSQARTDQSERAVAGAAAPPDRNGIDLLATAALPLNGRSKAESTYGRRPAGDHGREAARQVLRDALAKIGDARTSTPHRGVGVAPQPVATQALVGGVPAAIPTAPPVVSNDKSPAVDVAEWLDFDGAAPVEFEQAPETASRHSGQQRSGHGQDQAPPSFARAAGLGTLSNLPASMVFPGQASFAAALDHAAPTGAGALASFSSPVLQTVGPQVVRGLQLRVAAGGGDMTLTLKPEHLGTVTIEVKVDQQRVVATLTSDTPAVRGWMAAHEQSLKSSLAELGLSLDELVVREDDHREQQQREQAPQERRRKQQTETERAFEVVV